MLVLRLARVTDADALTEVQNAIHRAGLRESPVDRDQIIERYLDATHTVSCTVAELDGQVVGFQSLKRAWPDNPYGVTEGWGIIGTHIHPDAGRNGIGRKLFAVSLEAAKSAGLQHIDATIGATNTPALAYYAAMGFVPYQEGKRAIPHRLDVT
ncbi:N-acetyltransferase family protein [Dermacoccaceae bacterium W4C1]